MQTLSSFLQANRVSAILRYDDCDPDQLVQPEMTEEEFQEATKKFAHIEWRSIAEVIQYLGAVVRNQDLPHALSWFPPNSTDKHVLFKLAKVTTAPTGWATVTYRGATYGIDPAQVASRTDHTLEALTFLNELIGTARVSSDIPVTQPLQVLP